MKNIMDELTRYRVKVERDGKEIVNVPGILALPGALLAPKASIIGAVAASLLGCSIHLEDAEGKSVDVGKKMQEAADSFVDTAKKTARTIKEEMDKAWESISADDPEGCPAGEENKPDDAENKAEVVVEEPEKNEADDIPVIRTENQDKAE